MKPHTICQMGIARTFQNIRLFANMTTLENVMVGRHTRTKAGPLQAVLRTPKFKREEQQTVDEALKWLRFVGLARQGQRARQEPARTASSAGSRSRARWPPSRSSSCSTSRPPA